MDLNRVYLDLTPSGLEYEFNGKMYNLDLLYETGALKGDSSVRVGDMNKILGFFHSEPVLLTLTNNDRDYYFPATTERGRDSLTIYYYGDEPNLGYELVNVKPMRVLWAVPQHIPGTTYHSSEVTLAERMFRDSFNDNTMKELENLSQNHSTLGNLSNGIYAVNMLNPEIQRRIK